jgi:hypothetical protein
MVTCYLHSNMRKRRGASSATSAVSSGLYWSSLNNYCHSLQKYAVTQPRISAMILFCVLPHLAAGDRLTRTIS